LESLLSDHLDFLRYGVYKIGLYTRESCYSLPNAQETRPRFKINIFYASWKAEIKPDLSLKCISGRGEGVGRSFNVQPETGVGDLVPDSRSPEWRGLAFVGFYMITD
jgi:hypothetical protein